MSHSLSEKKFRRLLFFLLAYLFITPFIPETASAVYIIQFILSVTLFVAAYTVRKTKHQRSIAVFLMATALSLHWLGVFNLVPFSVQISLIIFIIFYALLVYAFLKQLLQAKQVTTAMIMATLCLYLIIGLLWGAGYTLIYNLYPGSFDGVLLEKIETSKLHIFNYFSIVTLTTLGYGDIAPQIPEAASLCQMQAIVGQFFTAVLVAWLVGMYSKSARQSDDSHQESPE